MMTEETFEPIKNLEAAIEAILYAAGYPVSYAKLSDVLGISPSDVKTLVEHMAKGYNEPDSTRGILLLTFEDTCQFCTKEQYAPNIREALGIRRGGNLSASSLEVLAIIAYNQPTTRSFVDTVRGVDSNYSVNSLIDKGLIESIGRLDAPGRPSLYATTEKFLRVFGLSSLADLPEAAALDSLASQAEDAKDQEEATNPAAEELTAADAEENES